MIRLLLTLVIPGALVGLAAYFLWKGLKQMVIAFSKVEFIYVRFRDGVLVLRRQTRFGQKEVEFATNDRFMTNEPREDLTPTQLTPSSATLSWYHFPSGHPVTADSEEEEAIARCLRYAENTGLLAAEVNTDI